MASKKKIAISLTAIALIILAALFAIVYVFAARNANFGNEFEGSYTAYHVKATITGSYKVSGAITDVDDWTPLTTTDSTNQIVFTEDITTGSEGATKSFNAVNGLVLTSTDNVIFKYEIHNDGETNENFTIVGTQTGTFSNFTVEYQYQIGESAAAPMTAEESTIEVPATIEAGQTVTLYVIIDITDEDDNASFDGSVSWTLTGTGAVGA